MALVPCTQLPTTAFHSSCRAGTGFDAQCNSSVGVSPAVPSTCIALPPKESTEWNASKEPNCLSASDSAAALSKPSCCAELEQPLCVQHVCCTQSQSGPANVTCRQLLCCSLLRCPSHAGCPQPGTNTLWQLPCRVPTTRHCHTMAKYCCCAWQLAWEGWVDVQHGHPRLAGILPL